MFANDIISYAKSPKDTNNSTDKLVATNKLHLAHKIKTKKLIIFLYANRDVWKEIQENNPNENSHNNYLVVPKEVLYNENEKILMKEIKKEGYLMFMNGNN